MTTDVGSTPVRAPVGWGFMVAYMAAFLGLWVALLTPPILTIALRLAQIDPANKERNLALVLGVGAVVAMVANPVAGLLSDRSTSRWGMRRPWMLGGLVLGVAGIALVATGPLWQIAVGWCLAQLGFNAVLAAITAVLPDQVPQAQRGKVSGLLGLCVQVAVVLGVAITHASGGQGMGMFLWPCAIAALAVLVFCGLLDDRRQTAGDLAPASTQVLLKSFWISPRAAPDFALAFVSRFLLFVGLATLLNNQVYFLMERLQVPGAGVPRMMLTVTLVSTVATVFGSVFSGWLSDRLGRRKPFVLWAAFIFGLGLLMISLAPDLHWFLAGVAVCGLGQGSYLAVDLALVTEVLPNQDGDAAKDLGIFNLASAMPQSVAPAIAPLFLSIGVAAGEKNYGALFAAAAAFAAAGALAVIPIRKVR